MKMTPESFEYKLCSDKNIGAILHLQEEAFETLPSSDYLRRNSKDTLLQCVNPPHVTLGAFHRDELAAFSVLYFPSDEKEDLSQHLQKVEISGLKSANNKLCIVKKEFRGNSLQYELGIRLEKYALESNTGILCATVFPDNIPSIKSIERLGYVYNRTLTMYGLCRNLYYKLLGEKPVATEPANNPQ